MEVGVLSSVNGKYESLTHCHVVILIVVLLLRKVLSVNMYLSYLVGLTCVAETAALSVCKKAEHVLRVFFATWPETETFHQLTVPPKKCQPQFPCGDLMHTIRELVKVF